MALLKFKRSAVPGKVPTLADLSLGELAINTYDGKVYIRKDSGTASIVEVGGGSGVLSFNSRTGAVTLTSGDVTGALGYTPANRAGDTFTGNIGLTAGGRLQFSSSAYITPENNVSGAEISTPGAITFRTGSGTPERARFDGSGNLLIGTTTSTGKRLTLAGSADISMINTANTSGFDIGLLGGSSDATAFIYQRANSAMAFGTNNSTRLTIGSGGEVTANVDFRAPIFYDSQNTAYYLDPQNTSVLWEAATYYLRNIEDVSVNHPYGIYFSNNRSSAYAIFRESGAWTNPFPDLRIAFHTGIKIGANAGYQGVRFYSDFDMATQVMSVNNASDPLGGLNVYVNNSLQADSSLRAPIFYDSNNTAFYLDPASTSVLNGVSAGTVSATNFTAANAFYVNGFAYYLNSTNGGWYSNARIQSETDMRAPIYYDSSNTGYYVDPNGTSLLNTVGVDSLLNLSSGAPLFISSASAAYQRVDGRNEGSDSRAPQATRLCFPRAISAPRSSTTATIPRST